MKAPPPRQDPKSMKAALVKNEAGVSHATIKEFFNDDENAKLHQTWLEELHKIPELAYEEEETANFVCSTLEKYCPSLKVDRPFKEAPTCIVAVFTPPGNPSLKPILLRGDMDALPMAGATDENERHAGTSRAESCCFFPPSKTPSTTTFSTPGTQIPRPVRATATVVEGGEGEEEVTEDRHHGCGHDGHTAGMLVSAHWMHNNQHLVQRKVVLLFQPAEESKGDKEMSGGQLVAKEGLITSLYPEVHACYALHGGPKYPLGTFVVGGGAITSQSGQYTITVTGTGGHAAFAGPDQTEPLLAAAAIVQAGQSIIARRVEPSNMAILAFTIIRNVGSSASNVCPSKVEIVGSLRSFDLETWDYIEKELRTVATNVAQSFGCTATLAASKGYPVTLNAPDAGLASEEAARRVQSEEENLTTLKVGQDVPPMMGSEDFSYLLQQRPGALSFMLLGEHLQAMHVSDFKFPPEAISFSGRFFVELILGRDIVDPLPPPIITPFCSHKI